MEADAMTVIDRNAAMKRFHQGLYYLSGICEQAPEKAEAESFLAVVTVMPYLGAYAYPDENLYGLKGTMTAALKPLQSCIDVEPSVDKALRLAEVFRRPWSEPAASGKPTI